AMTGMALDFFERLAALVEDAREREGLRAEVPATLAAMNFFAIYVLVVDSWLGSPWGLPRESFEPMLRDALALQIDGLREASASRRGGGRPCPAGPRRSPGAPAGVSSGSRRSPGECRCASRGRARAASSSPARAGRPSSTRATRATRSGRSRR